VKHFGGAIGGSKKPARSVSGRPRQVVDTRFTKKSTAVHTFTCYKGTNCLLVGRTAGRGKKSTSNKPLIPIKDIWLYPLRRDWQGVLCCDGG